MGNFFKVLKGAIQSARFAAGGPYEIEKPRKSQTPSEKEIYEYEILEPYRINIEETNRTFLANGGVVDYIEGRKFCELVAENEKYEFYSYRTYSDGSGGYLLRRKKNNPQNIVYFGKNRDFSCIFHDYLFLACRGNQDPRYCPIAQHIETGELIKCDWLSKEQYIRYTPDGFGRGVCVDSVDNMVVEQGKLIFKVSRKEPNARFWENEQQDRYVERTYDLVVEYADYQFKRKIIDHPIPEDVCILKYNQQIKHELLNIGEQAGFIIDNKHSYIPKFSVRDNDVCTRLIREIEKYGETNPRANIAKLSLAWCAYAGIGTVHHWKVDGDSFYQYNIFETLTEQRGVYAMDEYVQDCIEEPHDSPEGRKLTAHIMSMAEYCMDNILYNDSTKSVQFLEAAETMFEYGMRIAFQRIDSN